MTYHVAAGWHGLIMLDLQKSNKLLICISKITDYYRLNGGDFESNFGITFRL